MTQKLEVFRASFDMLLPIYPTMPHCPTAGDNSLLSLWNYSLLHAFPISSWYVVDMRE